MALKIIHVMEFQILFAQILFYNLATFANRLRLLGRSGMDDINQSAAPYGLASWISFQHLA